MEELKKKNVLIVGAGVAGLSTSYYLAKAGVKVKVLDYQPYEKSFYSPSNGCDAASADVNKIFRAAYGEEVEYQRLAYRARSIWSQWNIDIASTPPSSLPPGISPSTKFFYPSGFLRLPLHPTSPLSEKELSSLSHIASESASLRARNYVLSNPEDVQRAKDEGWERQLDLWTDIWTEKGGDGVFDATAGFVRADKACVWMRWLAEREGVEFVLGEEGRVGRVIEEGKGDEKRAIGVETTNGKVHSANLVIISCGGWTPTLLPQVKDNLEATGGSVVTLQLPPQSERPDLWEKYAPENFPVVSRGVNDGSGPLGGCYGFPRMENGAIKIGWRGLKWTNFASHPLDPTSGLRISTPLTAYSSPSPSTPPLFPLTLPNPALQPIKSFIHTLLPDLVSVARITETRICWYCDSLDNNFLVDYVPGYGTSLAVVGGGSGHMFKFLPILGLHVLDVLTGSENEYTKLWKWKTPAADPEGKAIKSNGLEEGESGPRVLSGMEWARKEEWEL